MFSVTSFIDRLQGAVSHGFLFFFFLVIIENHLLFNPLAY